MTVLLRLQRAAFILLTAVVMSRSVSAATITLLKLIFQMLLPVKICGGMVYRSQGARFFQSEFFDIYFNPLLYGTLMPGPALNAGWDTMVLQQPNPVNLPPFDRGIFDSSALVNNPSLASAFSVSFVYLGTGSPGSQPYEIFDANASLLESGLTRPVAGAVPEPST